MEGKSPSLLLQKRNWIFRQNINRKFLRSYSGIIHIAEMQKNMKFWNTFIVMYTSVTAVLLFVLSSFLTNEAVKLGDSYHDTPLQPKCVTCSKINIASVFGFISPILFTIDFFLYTRQYGFPCSKPNGRQVNVQHVQVTPMTENRGEQTD